MLAPMSTSFGVGESFSCTLSFTEPMKFAPAPFDGVSGVPTSRESDAGTAGTQEVFEPVAGNGPPWVLFGNVTTSFGHGL
jgi:hypothetical protein